MGNAHCLWRQLREQGSRWRRRAHGGRHAITVRLPFRQFVVQSRRFLKDRFWGPFALLVESEGKIIACRFLGGTSNIPSASFGAQSAAFPVTGVLLALPEFVFPPADEMSHLLYSVDAPSLVHNEHVCAF